MTISEDARANAFLVGAIIFTVFVILAISVHSKKTDTCDQFEDRSIDEIPVRCLKDSPLK